MELIRPFAKVGKNDAGIAGGKGASLGEMTQAGIPVPPGYVILSDAFERFIDETDLNVEINAILGTVNTENMQSVEDASGKIQELILAAKMPEDIGKEVQENFATLDAEFVAVRSSATAEDSASAAWAGQLDTYLNTTKATLLENVQRCWASLFTPRAIFYRFEKGLHATKISVAVVVQKMVNSDAAGIAFSVHPVTEDYNQIIIEAGFGLGEAVVSGQVTPDSYVITKEPREIIDKNISDQNRGMYRKEGGGNEWRDIPAVEAGKQVLTDEQIMALAETVVGIENHYGFPVDTEWAMEAGKMYITQSRPITTLTPPVANEPIPGAPETKPENFKSAPPATSADGAEPDVEDFEFLGRYTSSPFASWVWFDRSIEAFKNIPDAAFVKTFRMMAVPGADFFVGKGVRERMADFIREKVAQDAGFFRKMSDQLDANAQKANAWATQAHTVNTADAMRGIMEHGRNIASLWSFGFFASLPFDGILEEEAKQAGIPSESIRSNVHPRPTLVSERQEDVLRLRRLLSENEALPDGKGLTQFFEDSTELKEAFNAHLAKFAWLPIINYEGVPLTLDKLVEEVAAARPPAAESAREAPTNPAFQKFADAAAEAMYLNQAGVEYFSTFNEKTRSILARAAQEVGVTYENALLLLPNEFYAGKAVNPEARTKVLKRKADGWCLFISRDNEMCIYDDRETVRRISRSVEMPASSAAMSEISGTVGNKGQASGKARIVLKHSDFSKLQAGEVLVTSMTTPDYVPLMQRAAAIITDQGGMLSHAAIMSRELGKPCVIGTKFATQILKDGDTVEVDANAGIVRIIERHG